MKKSITAKTASLTLALAIGLGFTLTGCSGGGESATQTAGTTAAATTAAAETAGNEGEESKSAEWIADRTITVQAYVDDIGYSMPDNWESTPVYQAILERTGIDLQVQYTPGEDDASVMSTQLAAGNFPDVIVSYLNNSSRPEMIYLLAAARDGLFADISSYLTESEVYSKYLEPDYLPVDSYENIVFREDFNGAVYLLHLSMDRVDNSMTFDPEVNLLGGMYIQSRIVDELGIDPMAVNNTDDLYNLLVAIKEHGFTDENGNAVYPLGPKYWGGSPDSIQYIMREFCWNSGSVYNITEDGEILHEAETEYAYKKIEYMQKLLAEGLVNPEFFTMDSTRADEASRSKNSAIMSDVHNYESIIYETGDWEKLGPQVDYTGSTDEITNGKTGNGAWAISAKAENPDEIFKFFDWLASDEGQILSEYGVEGVSYTLDENGQPRLTDEVVGWLNDGDATSLRNNVGAGFDSSGFVFFSFMMTDKAYKADFGESRPGASSSSTYSVSLEIGQNYLPYKTYRLVEGLSAEAYLNMDEMASVKEQLSLMDYNETLIQAIYASSYDESVKIIEAFVNQMYSAGLQEYKDYLYGIYEENPDLITFYR